MSLFYFFNPFNWLLGRSPNKFINDKPQYDMSWVFPKLKKTNTRCWSVFSAMTIASVGFLSKMFIGELLNTEVTERDRTSPLDYALGNAKTKNACCLVQPQRNKVKWPLRCDKICDEGKKVKEDEEEGE